MAVLDASFIVKLVLREPRSEEALEAFRKLVASGEKLRTPCIALAEALNAIWKHVSLLRDLDRRLLPNVLKQLTSLRRVIHVHPIEELLEQSIDVAIELSITVYDALYIALAQRYKDTLYTFDTKLASKARRIGLDIVSL